MRYTLRGFEPFLERLQNKPMETNIREWLTVEQAADYLQLSQSSIRSYIRQEKLDARRIAGKRKVLIHRDELLKLLEPARGADLADISGDNED